MSSIVYFNGNEYDIDKIHTQAALGHDIEVKRTDVVLSSDVVNEEEVQPPTVKTPGAESSFERTVAVYRYFGRYYIMQGLVRAVDGFAKGETIKAKLISKHMLKKCETGYEGAKIVVETPEPPRRSYSSDREQRNDYSRPKYTRDR
jgi:hypothetical protein